MNPSLSARFLIGFNGHQILGGISGGKSRFAELTSSRTFKKLARRKLLRKPQIPLFVTFVRAPYLGAITPESGAIY